MRFNFFAGPGLCRFVGFVGVAGAVIGCCNSSSHEVTSRAALMASTGS